MHFFLSSFSPSDSNVSYPAKIMETFSSENEPENVQRMQQSNKSPGRAERRNYALYKQYLSRVNHAENTAIRLACNAILKGGAFSL